MTMLTRRRAVGIAAATIATAPVLAVTAAGASVRPPWWWPPFHRPRPPVTRTLPPPTGPTSSVAPPTTAPIPPSTLPVSCTAVVFERATVTETSVGAAGDPAAPTYHLEVQGQTAYFNQRVQLVPVTYIRQPEYWIIEVQGCMSGDIGLPATRPYTATLDFQGSMGTRGIAVVGADRTRRFDLPPPPTGPGLPPGQRLG